MRFRTRALHCGGGARALNVTVRRNLVVASSGFFVLPRKARTSMGSLPAAVVSTSDSRVSPAFFASAEGGVLVAVTIADGELGA